MDFNTMLAAIDNHGFPIICALAMAWFIYQIFKKTMSQHEANIRQIQEQNEKREERHYQQIDKFSETLDSFNTTLTKIDARLEIVEQHILDKKE